MREVSSCTEEIEEIMEVDAELIELLEHRVVQPGSNLARRLRQGEPGAFVAVGDLLLQAGRELELAERCFRAVVASGLAAANVNLGRVLSRLPGREADAERAYRQAIEADPTGAYNNLGVLLRRIPGREADAEGCYREAIARGDRAAIYNLALQLCAQAGREAEAKAQLEAALAAGFPDAHRLLADLLARSPGHEAEALGHYEEAIRRGEIDACAGAGLMAMARGKNGDAERYLRAGVEAGRHEAMNNMGMLLLQEGRLPAEAEALFRRAICLGNVDALNNLGALLLGQAGRESEALSWFLLATQAGHTEAGKNLGAAHAALAARGVDLSRLTREAIRTAQSRAGEVRIAPAPAKERVLAALRRAFLEGTREAMAAAVAVLGPATLAHQRQGVEEGAGTLPKARPCADAHDLLTVLAAEHQDGLHVYRGQLRRQKPFRKLDGAGNEFWYENLFPIDFRFVTKYPGADDPRFVEQLNTVRRRSEGESFRFMQHVVARCRADLAEGRARSQWLGREHARALEAVLALPLLDRGGIPQASVFGDRFGGAGLWRLLWSLAQHYELSTALLDVTYSPSVAVWFATHEWDERRLPPREGSGVVYRFDVLALEGLLRIFSQIEELQAADLGMPASPRVAPFLQDLRSIPGTFAARPTGQQGGSLYGLDSLWLLESLSASGALEMFEFPHGADDEASGVARATIMPHEDPFLDVKKSFLAASFG